MARFGMPKSQKNGCSTLTKGRPLTDEEFERMLKATASVVGDEAAPAWRRYLRGLWTSGLRLKESLNLSWDQQGGLVAVLPEQGRPTLMAPAELEKGRTDRILPVAPEFALLLAETPPEERTGPVFALSDTPIEAREVSAIISAIGKKAGVVVRAGDFRLAFRERWVSRAMLEQLQELMRHESIETTLRYYVGRNAERTADVCWDAFERAQAGANSQPPRPPAETVSTSTGADAGRR
jgi:integrase